ncbi:hypothetical protein [Pigmentiphaga sp.]|uniref:hypothetical protein n=1 Tax=Pigmentiphaga sp. TaxID=1977564 RepID=UPI0025E95FA9|nr:hypothetical protein [Pigmentiphaga sp.]
MDLLPDKVVESLDSGNIDLAIGYFPGHAEPAYRWLRQVVHDQTSGLPVARRAD